MSTLGAIRGAAANATRVVKPPPASRNYTGVVVSAGKMSKTVKVRIMKQDWNKRVRKFFDRPVHYLTHDPASSLREGDIIRLASGNRYAKHVRHVVTQIIAPFGPPVSERPPLPSLEELQARKDEKSLAKAERRATRARESMQKRKQERQLLKMKDSTKTTGEPENVELAVKPGAKQYKESVRSDMVIEGSGGLHHPGKVHERAMANSREAMKSMEKVQKNEEELKKIDRTLEQMRLDGKEVGVTGAEELREGKETMTPTTEISRDQAEKAKNKSKGWFGW